MITVLSITDGLILFKDSFIIVIVIIIIIIIIIIIYCQMNPHSADTYAERTPTPILLHKTCNKWTLQVFLLLKAQLRLLCSAMSVSS